MPWQVLQENAQDINTQVSPVHAGLLPTADDGMIVFFGGYFGHAATYLFDVATNALTLIPDSPKTNMFCCGHTFLADGRLLVAGGQNDEEAASHPPEVAGEHLSHPNQGPGERACYIFRPRRPPEDAWQVAASLNYQPDGAANRRGGGRWYPSVVSLGSGEVFAMGGHPDITDYFLPDPDKQNYRHNNNTPELYSPGGDTWTLLTDGSNPDDLTADKQVITDGYHRLHLMPDGSVFFSTRVQKGDPKFNRFYNPYTGKFEGPFVTPPATDSPTGVLLPLLPDAEGFCSARIMVCGHVQPMRIDIKGAAPQWVSTSARTGAAAGLVRANACAVILPTGDVFISGGLIPSTDTQHTPSTPVRLAEIYRPGIDWGTHTYDDPNLPAQLREGWFTGEEAAVPRGYHSVAMLLPNGRVWTAGSTDFGADDPATQGVDFPTVDERRIEIYIPDYDGGDRPAIKSSPASVGYDQPFEIFTDQAQSIQRAALIRCGSVTHAFDVDQRYVALNIEERAGDRLVVTSPKNSNIAPAGYYMLWIVDEAGMPCQRARFIRVAPQKCFIISDRSAFSVLEVESLKVPAPFSKAFYVVLDGFMKHEVGSPPAEPSIDFLDADGNTVAGIRHELNKSPDPEADDPDIAQRYIFSYDVIFDSTDAFAGLTEQDPFREITLLVAHGAHVCEAKLVLTVKSHPYMRDGDVPWLSIDLQVFTMRPGKTFAKVTHGEGPGAASQFIQKLLERFNSETNSKLSESEHPYAELVAGSDSRALEPASRDLGGHRAYNYAVARVRFRAAEEDANTAHDVRVFFRVFTTADTALSYTEETYPREGEGGGARPLVGYNASEIATMPFFAEPRAGGAAAEFDLPNLKDIEGKGDKDVYTYYGCWLDFNQEDESGEPAYRIADPADGQLKTIQEVLLRNDHLCLVAELYYPSDPISPDGAATPGSSDYLAQRNLVLAHSDNPGSAATHTVQTTFELKPSGNLATRHLLPRFGREGLDNGRNTADEVLIHWNNLPRDSHVTLYLPDVDVDEVLAYANSRLGPNVLRRVDEHTIYCKVGGVTYIPLPGGREANIPGLMTVQLPPDVKKGQEFNVVVQQMSGARRRITGSFQFTIPVTTGEELLPQEVHKLSVLRHVALAMPAGSRWQPIFTRYLDQIADRVRALGGDPDEVAPSAAGTGRAAAARCCPAQWLLPAVLAPLFVLLGLLPLVWSAALMALGTVLLAAILCYWAVRCRPSPCDIVNASLLGVGAASAVLGVVALFGYATTATLTVLIVLGLLSGLLILVAVVGQCWGQCWCPPKMRPYRRKRI